MATTDGSGLSDGPVLSLINKRIRALRKKLNRIVQLEEAIAQGKPLNKEQEDFLRSKPYVTASIDELDKLRQPLAVAVSEEISLAGQRHQVSASSSLTTADSDAADDDRKEQNGVEIEPKVDHEHAVVEDLLHLLYFASMFDVKGQNDFTSTMLTRTHERGCCLIYDYVTDDEAMDFLGERDLDFISMLGGLLVSRPVNSTLSHKNALQQCVEHAKQWFANSEQPIYSDSDVTYAGLRTKLNKIMASDYFTTTPEMKATVEMAAAAARNSASFQVPMHSPVMLVSAPVQEEDSDGQYQHKDEDATDLQGNGGTYDDQSSPVEEPYKGEFDSENPAEVPAQTDPDRSPVEEQNQIDESREQHYGSQRNYQNQRSGRGGGRRGYPNGRGGRGSSRGGAYQNGNGRNQYYDQGGNYFQRSYYNNRGRGGRAGGGGGNFYNNSGAQPGHITADS